MLPVEDDEIADALVGVADPVAHLGASVGIGRPQRRLGMGLVEIFADRAAFIERAAVVQDEEGNDAVGVELQILRRVMLHLRQVDETLSNLSPFSARQSRTRREALDLQA